MPTPSFPPEGPTWACHRDSGEAPGTPMWLSHPSSAYSQPTKVSGRISLLGQATVLPNATITSFINSGTA